jgi:transcriptional regulator with XRE-family HTH domain
MKLSQSLHNFKEETQKLDTYWVEKAKLDFAKALEQRRKYNQIQYSVIANKLSTSAAYISKVFRGDTNLTIESMVKLARATGGRIEINIVDEDGSTKLSVNQSPKPKVKMNKQTSLSISTQDHD